MIRAVIFDAYGTLFDVYSIGALANELFPGQGPQLSELWRDKQIEYTRLRTLCSKYVNFWKVTEDALEFSCEKLNLNLLPINKNRLMDQYAKLTAFPEVKQNLDALKKMGLPLGILSNGNLEMIESATQEANLDDFFNHILSVDTIKKFKTAPEAYQLGPDAFKLPVSDILFVSSNCWDICGATWFGYTTIWINRAKLPMEHLGISPKSIGHSLSDVTKFVQILNN